MNKVSRPVKALSGKCYECARGEHSTILQHDEKGPKTYLVYDESGKFINRVRLCLAHVWKNNMRGRTLKGA